MLILRHVSNNIKQCSFPSLLTPTFTRLVGFPKFNKTIYATIYRRSMNEYYVHFLMEDLPLTFFNLILFFRLLLCWGNQRFLT
jgi:hypothetical protein